MTNFNICKKNPTKKVKHVFPRRQESLSEIRWKTEMYQVNRANTERLQMTSIPQMQQLLNKATHK